MNKHLILNRRKTILGLHDLIIIIIIILGLHDLIKFNLIVIFY